MEFFVIITLLFTVVVLISAALISNSISKQEKQLARLVSVEQERLKTENYLAQVAYKMAEIQVVESNYRVELMRRAAESQCSGTCSESGCSDIEDEEVIIDAEDEEVPDGTFGSNDKG